MVDRDRRGGLRTPLRLVCEQCVATALCGCWGSLGCSWGTRTVPWRCWAARARPRQPLPLTVRPATPTGPRRCLMGLRPGPTRARPERWGPDVDETASRGAQLPVCEANHDLNHQSWPTLTLMPGMLTDAVVAQPHRATLPSPLFVRRTRHERAGRLPLLTRPCAQASRIARGRRHAIVLASACWCIILSPPAPWSQPHLEHHLADGADAIKPGVEIRLRL
jgi:hypothetical protein